MCEIDGQLFFELYKGTMRGTVVKRLQYFFAVSHECLFCC